MGGVVKEGKRTASRYQHRDIKAKSDHNPPLKEIPMIEAEYPLMSADKVSWAGG